MNNIHFAWNVKIFQPQRSIFSHPDSLGYDYYRYFVYIDYKLQQGNAIVSALNSLMYFNENERNK